MKKVNAFTNSIVDNNNISNLVYSKERFELNGPVDNQYKQF